MRKVKPIFIWGPMLGVALIGTMWFAIEMDQREDTGTLDKYPWPSAEPASAAYAPGRVVLVDASGASRRVDRLHDRLPPRRRADFPGEVGSVAFLVRATERIGRYQGGGSAYVHVWELTVVDPVQQVVTARRSFRSRVDPPESVRCSDAARDHYGSEPNDEVLQFLSTLWDKPPSERKATAAAKPER